MPLKYGRSRKRDSRRMAMGFGKWKEHVPGDAHDNGGRASALVDEAPVALGGAQKPLFQLQLLEYRKPSQTQQVHRRSRHCR